MLPAGMLGGGLGYTSLSFSIENYLNSEDFLIDIVNNTYDIDGSKTTLSNQWGSDYNNFVVLNPMTFAKRFNSYFNLFICLTRSRYSCIIRVCQLRKVEAEKPRVLAALLSCL